MSIASGIMPLQLNADLPLHRTKQLRSSTSAHQHVTWIDQHTLEYFLLFHLVFAVDVSLDLD
jgi:hypothetical protein